MPESNMIASVDCCRQRLKGREVEAACFSDLLGFLLEPLEVDTICETRNDSQRTDHQPEFDAEMCEKQAEDDRKHCYREACDRRTHNMPLRRQPNVVRSHQPVKCYSQRPAHNKLRKRHQERSENDQLR